VIHVERDVNAEPAASAYPLEARSAQLTGLVERDDYDEDDINHRQTYNHERGVLLGSMINLREDGIETVTKKTVEILSVHPSNVCVKEPPAQRDDSGVSF
jgi:hypothetical protein